MKFLILFIFIVLISKVLSGSDSECVYLGVCADIGERCDFEYYYNTSVPSNQIFVSCKSGSFCPNVYEPVCTKLSKVGEICGTEYSRCLPPLSCVSMDGAENKEQNLMTCQTFGYLQLGDDCEYDQQCNTGSCTQGKCGAPAKHYCGSAPYICPFGTYCDTSYGTYNENQCKPLKSEGEVCSDEDAVQCNLGHICVKKNEDSINLTCEKIFSKDLGDYCYNMEENSLPFVFAGSSECQLGQSCVDNVCTAKKTINHGGQTCSTHSNCDSQSICLCDSVTDYNQNGTCTKNPINYGNDCQETNIKLIECISEHKCQMIFNPYSCLMKNCGDILCSNTCFDFSEYPSCGEPITVCEYFGTSFYKSSASIAVPSLFTFMIILILNFLF